MHGSLKQQQLFWQLVPRLANTSQQSYEHMKQFLDKMRLEHKNKRHLVIFMFVPCINSIKALFYYSKLMHTIIKS